MAQAAQEASAIPILSWLPNYDRAWLRPDILAGITLATFTKRWLLLAFALLPLWGISGLYWLNVVLFAGLLLMALFWVGRRK